MSEEAIQTVEFLLWARGWETEDENIDDYTDDFWTRLGERWRTFRPGVLEQEHSGDCTKQPWTCLRCLCEDHRKIAEKIVASLEPPQP